MQVHWSAMNALREGADGLDDQARIQVVFSAPNTGGDIIGFPPDRRSRQ